MAPAPGRRPADCWRLHALFLLAATGLRQLPPVSEADDPRETILVAVNVHERPDVAALQLKNINAGLNGHFRPQVALSCNADMKAKLSRIALPSFAQLNPEVIEKKRFHGSLLHGIVSNLRFLTTRHNFSYALVLSSKSRIDREITLDDVRASIGNCSRFIREQCGNSSVCHQSTCSSIYRWNWGVWKGFRSTLLSQHVEARKGRLPKLLGGAHEGLVLDERAVMGALRFLDEHPQIAEDLFAASMAVEEFALQTLAAFVGGSFGYLGYGRSGPGGFYKIGKVPRQAGNFLGHDKLQVRKPSAAHRA